MIHVVCRSCDAIYPRATTHTCNTRNPKENPMPNPPTYNEQNAQNIRLQCLRLAAETGMQVEHIQATAADWADFVLDNTTSKEN